MSEHGSQPTVSVGLTAAAAIALLAAPVAFIDERPVSPDTLLADVYAAKAAIAWVVGLGLILALAPRRDPAVRLPGFAVGGVAVLGTLTALAVVTASAPGEALLAGTSRLLLPAVALLIGSSRVPSRDVVTVAIATIAAILAVATIAEACGLAVSSTVINAPGATLAHRNNLAFHLALAAPVLLALASEAHGRSRVCWALISALVIVALFLTYSRTGWVAAGVGVAVGWLWARWRSRTVLGVIAIAAVILAIAPEHYLEGPVRRAKAAIDTSDEAWTCRSALRRDAVSHIAQRPWTGYGPGGYVRLHRDNDAVCRPDHPHNDVLTVTIELGVLGGVAFIVLVGGILVALYNRRTMALARETGPLAGALAVGLVLGVTNSPLALAPSAAWYWLLYGVALRYLTREAP